MQDPLSLVVLVLALAAGLVAAIAVAQLAQSHQAGFFRYFLSNILLFNLLILAGLVFRFLQIQSNELLLPMLPAVLVVMTALKLAWLYAFAITNRILWLDNIPDHLSRIFFRSGLGVLAGFTVLICVAWFLPLPILLQASLIILEALIIGSALLSSMLLIVKAKSLPRGGRRKSLLLFGAFHAVLMGLILAVLLAGWLVSGPQGASQIMLNGGFLLLFNLFQPYWAHRYRPAKQLSNEDKFEQLGITRREREIILLIQTGKSNQEIANALFISVATVKDHNHNLFRKCGVKNRMELANLFR